MNLDSLSIVCSQVDTLLKNSHQTNIGWNRKKSKNEGNEEKTSINGNKEPSGSVTNTPTEGSQNQNLLKNFNTSPSSSKTLPVATALLNDPDDVEESESDEEPSKITSIVENNLGNNLDEPISSSKTPETVNGTAEIKTLVPGPLISEISKPVLVKKTVNHQLINLGQIGKWLR